MNESIRARLDAVKTAIREQKSVVDAVAQCGITVESKPVDLPSRPGYEWKPYQALAGGPISWIESESEDKSGTADFPIAFAAGMKVYQNYYYTDGTTRYVCVQTGTPETLEDRAYFEAF